MRAWLLVWAMAVFPTFAAAQELNNRPLWQVDGSVGWFANERDEPTVGFAEDDNSRWVFGAAGGYYWTEHLRTEAAVSVTSEGRGYIPVPRGRESPPFDFGQYRVRDVRLTVQQFYQFGRNAWVHPYVGAGLAVSRETHQIGLDRWAFPDRVLPPDPSVRVRVRLKPMFSAGLKTYMTPRAFLRTEVGVSPWSPSRDAVLSVGVGADF